MADIISGSIVLLIVLSAGFYVYKAKKNGKKCIGCPYSKECGGKCDK